MSDKKTSIENAVERLTANYRKEELFLTKSGRHLPVRAAIINIVKEMRSVIFPGYFDIDSGAAVFPEHYTGYLLNDLFDRMQAQIETAFLYVGDDMTSACGKAAQITSRFFEQLPEVQEMLLKDVQAGFDGDPAAKSKEEIIFSYPGLGILAVGAVKARDYPLIQGFVLWIALIYMVVNLLVDISYHYIDPRTREGENG